jgi:hypothetical protein
MAAGNKIGRLSASVGLLTDIHTTQLNPLGCRAEDDLGNEYIYLGGVASLAAGDWVFYNSNAAQAGFLTARLPASTATYGMLAVAMAAVLATQFGWFQTWGLTPTYTAIATDAAADGKGLSAASGTIGQMKTAATSTKNVFGAVCVGASAANIGTAFITYPFEFGSATI